MIPAPGYYTEGEIGNTLLEAQGSSVVPATTGEVLRASIVQTFVENPTSRLYRFLARNLERNPITISAEEANAEYGVPGRLTFDAPISRQAARDLHDFHMNSAIREDVIARRNGGVATGGVARFVASIPAAIIDPLNIASAFLPGVREGRVAAFLGTAGATAGSRAAVRLLSGASQGLVGAAALEPLNMWLAAQERDDYTMGELMTNLAFGAVLGGVLHTGIGAFRDRRALPDWAAAGVTSQQHEAALRQAVSAVVEGRPVAAADVIRFVGVRQAREELETWYESLVRATRDAEDAFARADAEAAPIQQARSRLAEVRAEFDKIAAEVAEAKARLAEIGSDDITPARIASIETELAGVIPRARREQLEAQLRLLKEGGNPDAQRWLREGGDPEMTLEYARTQAQLRGLVAEQQRARLAVANAERVLSALERKAGAAEGAFVAADRALRARENIVQQLAERTIRRAAGRLGVGMSREEAAELASKLLRAKPEDVGKVLDEIETVLSSRAPAGPYRPEEVEVVGRAEMEQARADFAEAERAAEEAVVGAASPRRSAADAAADTAADQRAQTAPKAEGESAAQLAELEREIASVTRILDEMDKQELADIKARGGDTAVAEQQMKAARQEAEAVAQEGESLARAYEAAAVCSIRR